MNLIDRLLQVVKLKTSGNKAKFYRETGLSNGSLRNIKYTASEETIDKIISAYPDINKNWLLTGIGEMLITNQDIIEEPQQVYNIKPKKMEDLTFEELLFQYNIEKEVSADLNNHVLDLNRENQILKQQLRFIREICLKCETCKKAFENGKIKNSFG